MKADRTNWSKARQVVINDAIEEDDHEWERSCQGEYKSMTSIYIMEFKAYFDCYDCMINTTTGEIYGYKNARAGNPAVRFYPSEYELEQYAIWAGLYE